MKRVLSSFAALALASVVAFAVMPLKADVVVNSNVVRGEWTSDFAAAKEYADANAVPMLVYWTSPWCHYCQRLESVFETDEFRKWQHDRKMVMVFASGEGAAKQFAWNSSRAYPFVAVYWNKGDGNVILEKFTGRLGYMPWPAGTLLSQFTNSVDLAVGLAEIPQFIVEDGELTFVNHTGLTKFVVPEGTTSIGSKVFDGCTSLTQVTIPDSVTNIGSRAFWNCSGLTSVKLPASVTSIEYAAFGGCTGVKDYIVDAANPNYKSANGFLLTADGTSILYTPRGRSEIVIPDGVTRIRWWLFAEDEEDSIITSVVIADSVTTIEDGAFCGCARLTNVVLSVNLENLGYTPVGEPDGEEWDSVGVFEGCTGLKSIVLPDGLETIGYGSFSDCENLSSVTIPGSVTSIGDYAFAGCENLTSVTIPGSVTYIGEGVFDDSGLARVYILSGDENRVRDMLVDSGLDVSGIEFIVSMVTVTFDANGGMGGTTSDLLIGEALERPEVTQAGKVFAGWSPVPPVVAPASNATYVAQWVQQVAPTFETKKAEGGVAIKNCSYPYGDIVIPDEIGGKKVVAIANYAFFECSGITSVTIPDSVKTIGTKAFKKCSNMTSVKLPAGLTTLGQAAFQDCTSLTEVDVPAGIDYLWSSTFEGCSALRRASLPEGITAIGTSAFANCKSLEEVNIPSSVKTIKSFAFFSCESLPAVTLPKNLTAIEPQARYRPALAAFDFNR